MTTFTRRAIDRWQAASVWLAVRPHVMALILLGFASLFGGYGAYDYVTGDFSSARFAIICMILADIAAASQAIRAIRRYIAAGQDAS